MTSGGSAVAPCNPRHLARMWHGTQRRVQTTSKAQVDDLGLSRGTGDENRTRALGWGINGAWARVCCLACWNVR